MKLNKDEIVKVWKLDAAQEETIASRSKGVLQFMTNDFVDQLDAVIEPQVLANGSCEKAAALFRIGKSIGMAQRSGAPARESEESSMAWDDSLATLLGTFVAHNIKRVWAGGFLTVDAIQVDAFDGPSALIQAVPWKNCFGSSSRVLRLRVIAEMSRNLRARINSEKFGKALNIRVRSPWTADEESVDCVSFFCRGLVVGIMENWLLVSGLHRSVIQGGRGILSKEDQLVRDLGTAITSHCRGPSKDDPRHVVTAAYIVPDDSNRVAGAALHAD